MNSENILRNIGSMIPCLVEIKHHFHLVRKKSVGSMEDTDNDDDDTTPEEYCETLELEAKGENWLSLVSREEKDDIPPVKSVLDETQDADMLPRSTVPYPSVLSVSSVQQIDGLPKNDCYIVLDIDGTLPNVPPLLAVKDMRLPVQSSWNDSNNDSTNSSTNDENALKKNKKSQFEVCLARLSETKNAKDRVKKEEEGIKSPRSILSPWDGYDRLEPLTRRQLRLLRPGDRLVTRALLSTINQEGNDNEEEEFAAVGLVLEYRLESRRQSPPDSPFMEDNIVATQPSPVKVDATASDDKSVDTPIDTQATALDDEDDKDKRKSSPEPKVMESPGSSTQDDGAMTQALQLGQAMGSECDDDDYDSDNTTQGENEVNDDAEEREGTNTIVGSAKNDDGPLEAVELLVTQPDAKSDESDSENNMREDQEPKGKTDVTIPEKQRENPAGATTAAKSNPAEIIQPTTNTNTDGPERAPMEERTNELIAKNKDIDGASGDVDDDTTVGFAGNDTENVLAVSADAEQKLDVKKCTEKIMRVEKIEPADNNEKLTRSEKVQVNDDDGEDDMDATQIPEERPVDEKLNPTGFEKMELDDNATKGGDDDMDKTQIVETINASDATEMLKMKDNSSMKVDEDAEIEQSKRAEETRSDEPTDSLINQSSNNSSKRKYQQYITKNKSSAKALSNAEGSDKNSRESKRKRWKSGDHDPSVEKDADQNLSSPEAKDEVSEKAATKSNLVKDYETPSAVDETASAATVDNNETDASPSKEDSMARDKGYKARRAKNKGPAARITLKKLAENDSAVEEEEEFDECVHSSGSKPTDQSPHDNAVSDPTADGHKNKIARGIKADDMATPPAKESVDKDRDISLKTPAQSTRKRKIASKLSEQMKGNMCRARTPSTRTTPARAAAPANLKANTETRNEEKEYFDSEIRVMSTGVILSKAQVNVSQCNATSVFISFSNLTLLSLITFLLCVPVN